MMAMLYSKNKKVLLGGALVLLLAGLLFFGLKSSPDILVSDWQRVEDQNQKVSFEYPANFSSTYIFPIDWPPEVIVRRVPFNCVPTTKKDPELGETTLLVIDGMEYCVTHLSEGAAGNLYTRYSYIFQKGEKQIILNFSLRQARCESYKEAEEKDCQLEQASFDLNNIINKIAQSFKELE